MSAQTDFDWGTTSSGDSLLIWKLAWREFRYRPAFLILFTIHLSLGLYGLSLVNNFRLSLEGVLHQRSKNVLGADLGVSSRRDFLQADLEIIRKQLPEGTKEIGLYSMMTMGQKEKNVRLLGVNVIPDAYPFYGKLTFEDGSTHPGGVFLSDNEVWVYPEILTLFEVEIGEQIKIGNRHFKVTHVVERDDSETFSGVGVAPKVYINLEGAELADLLGPQSTKRREILWKLPNGLGSKELEALADKMEKELEDPAINLKSPKRVSQNLGRSLGYLYDFLGLVSLVALFLTIFGLGFLYRRYLIQRKNDLAIYACYGMKRSDLFKMMLIHLALLSLTGFLGTLILSGISFPLIAGLIGKLLPFALPPFPGIGPFVMSFLVAVVGTILLGLSILGPEMNFRPHEVFQSLEPPRVSKLKRLKWALPLLFFFWALSLVTAHSIQVGTLFFFSLVLLVVILTPISLGILKLIGKISPTGLTSRHLIRIFVNYPLATTTFFISLSMGTMLTQLIPQLEVGLKNEIETPGGGTVPDFFLFDIQDEEIASLKNFAKDNDVSLEALSPMIRGRLSEVNGEPFKRADEQEALTREEQRSRRIQNRGINLSFKEVFNWGETLIDGRAFSKKSGPEMGEISVETRYAKRLGLKIGDTMTFDIFDVPISGEVVSIRKVRWTSFLPNFFIVFGPGMLEDVPKTWLTGVSGVKDRGEFLRELYDQFPSVSSIDVSRVIGRIEKVLLQMSFALTAMSWLSIFVGLIVLAGMIHHQLKSREKNFILYKVMGLNHVRLRNLIILEFSSLALVSIIFGTLSSLVFNFVIIHLIFDGIVFTGFVGILLRGIGILFLVAAMTWWISRKVTNVPAKRILDD